MKYTVVNSGVIGNTVRELRQRFQAAAEMLGEGDAAIILSGINDMLYPGHRMDIREFENSLYELAGDFRSLGVTVILAAVPEISSERYFADYPESDVSDPDKLLAEADAVVRGIALAQGCRIWDIRKVLGRNMEYRLEDGMHLSPSGAEAAAAVLAEIIRRLMKDGGRVLCFGDSLFYGPWLKGRGKADAGGETVPSCLARMLNC